MANDLTDLKITEVSFCKRGMNQHAKISLFKSADNKAGSSGNSNPDGENMSDNDVKKIADLEKAVADLTARLEKSDAEAKVAKAVAGLSDVEKAHYEGLDESEKAAFLAKNADDRKAVVENIAKAEETVEINGSTIKKSVLGADVFNLLKSQAEEVKKTNERIAKAEEAAEMADLRKRADDEFPNVLGTTDERAAVLKFAKSAPEGVKNSIEAILKSANASAAFTTIGKNNAKTADVKKSFDEKVAEIKKRDNITEAQAMAKAAVEFPDLVPTQE